MQNKAQLIYDEIKKSLLGKDETVKKCVIALIGGGHILLEDIPGVGKTSLAKSIAAAAGLDTKRIQFTPDTLASDITGFTLWDAQKQEFRFREGAVMTNILLADEINRTSPRTQAALLQAMEEQSVSEDGVTYRLEPPFTVIATQNPYGSAGTMPLPQSQLDRFMMRLSLGRPTCAELSEIVFGRAEKGRYETAAVCGKTDVVEMQKEACCVYLSEPIAEWIAELVEKTYVDERIRQGASPRAALSLASAARAAAYFDNRDFVSPSDVAFLFTNCMAHRIILSPTAASEWFSSENVCEEILKSTPPPHVKGRRR